MSHAAHATLVRELTERSKDDAASIEMSGELPRIKFDLVELEVQSSEIIARFFYKGYVVDVQSVPAHLTPGDSVRFKIKDGYGTLPTKWRTTT